MSVALKHCFCDSSCSNTSELKILHILSQPFKHLLETISSRKCILYTVPFIEGKGVNKTSRERRSIFLFIGVNMMFRQSIDRR